MNIRTKLVAVAAAGFLIGYFAGREHLKYQIASSLSNIGAAFAGSMKTHEAQRATDTPHADITKHAPVSDAKANAAAYRDKVDLYDFSAKYTDSVLDGRIPGVQFKLKNNGDKTITSLKVVVYFQDEAGATIAEEDFYPINARSFMSSGPLKPGYVWQNERGKFFAAKRVPSEWKSGMAHAEIDEIEFE